MKHLSHFLRPVALLWMMLCVAVANAAGTVDPEAVTAMLNRIGGNGAAERFVTEVDAALSTDGADVFVIASKDGKPYIKGNTILSVTTGIGWYLNHQAGVNLAWNNLKTDLSKVSLPLPATAETHHCTAPYRYYLNYCTYSYSMAFWTWERWQQEVDWMALHGINMPLALVGADVVWKNVLTELGYTADEVNAFVAGPGFQAWWLMNNLEGWGGPNRAWWYERQEKLSKNILAAMRAYGMTPVLPGYSGMVPSNITQKKGWAISDPGQWIAFQRPGFLVPTDSHFAEMAALYYKHLAALMGTSAYYSMDPFHEGGNTSGVDLPKAYTAIRDAMNKVNPNAKWVIQSWNENPRYECLNTIEKGKLIVLDLFSDGTPKWQGGYNGHEMVYCMLHNFGGRVGLHGRLSTTIDGYYDALAKFPATMKGVGATPEGIETNPVLYDALFELPWRSKTPAATWLADYTSSRYGTTNADAKEAWQALGKSVYECTTTQQGTSEPIICARPALQVNSVSTWSTSAIYYDPQDVIRAAALMLQAKDALGLSPNYGYDLADMTRQAITDHAQTLLKAVRAAYDAQNMAEFKVQKEKFLQLILDQDRLLATNENFTLGRWTGMARSVPDEVAGTAVGDKDWMEWNARTQITVWGTEAAAGGLHDYSNREWSGLLKDFHYARWKKYFDALEAGSATPNASQWFAWEDAWTRNTSLSYSSTPTEETTTVAAELFEKYFGTLATADTTYYYPRGVETKAPKVVDDVVRGATYAFNKGVAPAEALSLGIDFNGDGQITANECVKGLSLAVPATAVTGKQKAELRLTDGTVLQFTIIVRDLITTPRTVAVATADAATGSAAIDGNSEAQVTNTSDVTLRATAATGYDFQNWTNKQGDVVSTANPYTYYGKEAETFTAHFIINKWGSPAEDMTDYNDVKSYEQYVQQMTCALKDQDAETIYTADACPEQLFNTVPTIVNVARGASFTIGWNDTEKNGLSYTRLSAYIDLNGDGDFTDEGEFLEVRGAKNSGGNGAVSEGTLRVILPADMPLGITHLRLRFDGSYSGGWDAATDAMPAKADTKRMVYDVPVNVLEIPATASTIEAISADPTKGTVAISGLSNPTVATPGDRIILQAQAQAGFKLDYWEDEYGRRVSTNANYSFVPAESGKFTAHFTVDLPAALAIGNYTFSHTEEGANLTLIKALSGEGPLVIPATIEGFTVSSLAPGALTDARELTALTLPATLTKLSDNQLFTTAFTGAGVQSAAIVPSATLKANEPWQLTLNVQATSGASFNEWGSTLLATGTDAFANDFSGGFQLYYAKDGSLVVKTKGEETKQTFTTTQGATAFTVTLTANKSNALNVAISAGGKTASKTITGLQLADIARFSTALPAGINLTAITATDPSVDTAPLRGCTKLEKITVATGNKQLKSRSGLLYTVANELITCPAALPLDTLTLPTSLAAVRSAAFDGLSRVKHIYLARSASASSAFPLLPADAYGTAATTFPAIHVREGLEEQAAASGWAAKSSLNEYATGTLGASGVLPFYRAQLMEPAPGLKAYVVTLADNGCPALVPVTDTDLFALRGGILLYGPASSACIVDLHKEEVTSAVANNLLFAAETAGLTDALPEGCTTTADVAYYAWRESGSAAGASGTASAAGFYPLSEGGAPFSVKADEVYLALPAALYDGSPIIFDFTTTGITAPIVSSAPAKLHSLDGRRLTTMPRHGVVIVNGKKVVR